MPWFRVDDTLHSHPKIRRAGPAALGLWTMCGSYASAYLTEGFVPRWYINDVPNGRKLVLKLVQIGLLSPGKNANGEQGYWFHDWAHYQESKEEVESRREGNRRRQRDYRDRKRAEAEAERNASPNALRNGVRNPSRNGTPTLPNPSTYVLGDEVTSDQVSNAGDSEHRIQDEPRSKPVDMNARKLSRIYTSKVKGSDPNKITGAVANMQFAGYDDDRIIAALERLTAKPALIVSIDVLRREIETDGKKPMPYGMTEKDGITYASDGRAIAGPGWNYS